MATRKASVVIHTLESEPFIAFLRREANLTGEILINMVGNEGLRVKVPDIDQITLQSLRQRWEYSRKLKILFLGVSADSLDIELASGGIKVDWEKTVTIPSPFLCYCPPQLGSIFSNPDFFMAAGFACGSFHVIAKCFCAWVKAREGREITITTPERTITIKGMSRREVEFFLHKAEQVIAKESEKPIKKAPPPKKSAKKAVKRKR